MRLHPNKLISYGLGLAQVEQQLANNTNNNVNAGGVVGVLHCSLSSRS